MCGRYVATASIAELSDLFDARPEPGVRLSPGYNIAPTQRRAVIRADRGAPGPSQRLISLARWGFLPPWARAVQEGARMINARAETVASSRAFGASFSARRCLVPADGWYEWSRAAAGRRGGPGRQACYVTRGDGVPLAFAGVFAVWRGAAEPLLTFAVLTTEAAGRLRELHDRMPLLLPPSRWGAWLHAEGADSASEALLVAPGQELLQALEIRPVDRRVGDVRNDGPELIMAVSRGGEKFSNFDQGDSCLF